MIIKTIRFWLQLLKNKLYTVVYLGPCYSPGLRLLLTATATVPATTAAATALPPWLRLLLPPPAKTGIPPPPVKTATAPLLRLLRLLLPLPLLLFCLPENKNTILSLNK